MVVALLLGTGCSASTASESSTVAPPPSQRTTAGAGASSPDAAQGGTVPEVTAQTFADALPAGGGPGPGPGTLPAGTTTIPLPPPSPALPPGDNRVYVLGDSVLAGAKVELPAALKGWKVTVDAVESRFVTQGPTVLKSRVNALDRSRTDAWNKEKAAAEAAGAPAPPAPAKATIEEALGRVVVINLCANYQAGGGFDRWVDQYMTYLAKEARVVWMTCSEWSDGQVEANKAIRAAAPSHPTMVVADWAPQSSAPGYTYADHIHLDRAGRAAVADLISRAVGPAPKG